MSILWLALSIVVTAVVLLQLLCFAIALYETVNLPDAQHARLTPAGFAAALGGFAVETFGVVAFTLALPLGCLPWRRVAGIDHETRPPLVFVPGWCMNRICFLLLRHRLRRDGWPHAIGVNYRSVGGDLLEGARRVCAAVEALCTESGAPRVILVGHDVGGIVCRAYLRYLGGAELAGRVVTLASPHRGSKLYALSLDPMLQSVRPESALLRDLAEGDPIPGAVDFTAIYSSFDHLILPASQAYYAGVANIEVEGVGHMGMLWSRRVYELILESIDYERPSTSTSACTQRARSPSSQ